MSQPKRLPGQILQALKHFTSKGAMDIEGFGEKLVHRFYDEGLVRSLPDIYRLTVDRLEPLEGFQRKSAENLVTRSSAPSSSRSTASSTRWGFRGSDT